VVQGPEIGCRGWIRTNDLQVMSLTSYQAAPPCNKGMGKVQLPRNAVNGIPYFSRTFISADPASGSSSEKVTKVEERFLIRISTNRDWTFTVNTSPDL
jgi:hypothetical protein